MYIIIYYKKQCTGLQLYLIPHEKMRKVIYCLVCCLVSGLYIHRSKPLLPPYYSSHRSKTSVSLYAKQIGIYVHIPFCRRRCRYCNFAIVPVGPYTDQDSLGFASMNEQYTKAILNELNSIQYKENVQLQSIYFGGGTPSLAPIETLKRILDSIRTSFSVADDAEVSIEMDPGTFTKEKLQEVKKMGFNRISLGIQSFDDDVLESLGRVHRHSDIFESIDMLRDVFGEDLNYSIDLISGVPKLSLALWASTLEIATHLIPQPKHMSLYDLQIETGTVFGQWYSDERIRPLQLTKGDSTVTINPLPSEEEAAYMYQYAAGYLRAKGYEHYEVSSYALLSGNDTRGPSPYRSQHNQIYWATGSEWYALGLGATSFVDKRLVARPRTLSDYLLWVDESNTTGETDMIGSLDLLLDTVLKRLRTKDGLQLDWVKEQYGDDYENAILRGAALGIELGMALVNGRVLKLVDPLGFLYSNTIISSIFVEIEQI